MVLGETPRARQAATPTSCSMAVGSVFGTTVRSSIRSRLPALSRKMVLESVTLLTPQADLTGTQEGENPRTSSN
jgi:hypothetical protein